jgi:imidazolonepropionase-like amidohydrolase
MKRLFVILLAAAPASAETVAVEHATIFVTPDQKIDDGTIVMKDGVILAAGASKGIAIPAGARLVDGKGTTITAGIVDAYDAVGLDGIEEIGSTIEGAFAGDQVHASYRALDGYDARSPQIPIARTGGVTDEIAVPRGALISGQSGWFALTSGGTDDQTVRAPLAMHAQLGDGTTAAGKGSRGATIELLREILDDTTQYAARRGDYERNAARKFAASRLDLEALVPVVEGRLPLVILADRESDILAAIRIANELKIKVVIASGAEAWMVAPELAKAKIPVILDPMIDLPSSFDALHVREDGAAMLVAAGVTIAFGNSVSNHLSDDERDTPSNSRDVRQHAGNAVANGLTWPQALAAMTSGPAAIFGLADRGTLAAGKVANVVVWSGDPLELSTRPLHVFVKGVEEPLVSRQTLLRDRYRTLSGPGLPGSPKTP